MKDYMQKLGKALMMPISIIAAAGLFLGIAAALQNPNIVGASFIEMTQLQLAIGFVRRLAGTLFGNLPILFAVAVAIGLSKDEKPTAAFASVIGFLVFHVTLNYILQVAGITAANTTVAALMEKGMSNYDALLESSKYESVLGIFTLRMNVFGGIVSGLTVAWLHNRFYRIELPTAINFFGGRRFVPIITTVAVPVIALASYFIWPVFNNLIVGSGNFISAAGLFGTFIFGFLERILIPTGLHHILNQTVRFTAVGGTAMIDGNQVIGSLQIFNAALASTSNIDISIFREATRFLAQGKIPVMMFGLPGAALAMYQTASEDSKGRVKALMIAAVAASFTTGITEPLEFSFIFISPILFLFHAIMTGLSFMLSSFLGVSIGNVQGGIIDLFVFGIFRGFETRWYFSLVLGIIFFFAYYYVFKYVIVRFKVETPGREENLVEGSDVVLPSDMSSVANLIIEGLGGKDNIQTVDNCFTRLRVELKDMAKVDESVIMQSKPAGIIKTGATSIQVIFGPKVEKISNAVKDSLK